MDERLSAILRGLPESEFAAVARGALCLDAPPVQAGIPTFTEITTPHAEARTIGIVRAEGIADGHAWSSVAKLIDLDVPAPPLIGASTAPENEEVVYEEGYFAGDGLRFRPARCHHISRPGGAIKIIWLEDLTRAVSAPFSLDAIAEIAVHLGEWNGVQAVRPPKIRFALGRDSYAARHRAWNHAGRIKAMRELGDHETVRVMYRDHSLDLAAEFVAQFDRLVERTGSERHSLAFGDCAAGNIFSFPGETVAIDWASLTYDPLGCDYGCFVGSCMSWGPSFVEVARQERELFEPYIAGLRDSGVPFDRDQVRRGAFGQIGHYLSASTSFPLMIARSEHKAFLEKRYGMPLEEVAEKGRGILELLPGYVEEFETLLR